MSACQTSIKRPIYYCSTAEAQILGPASPHEITTVIPSELIKVYKLNRQTLISQTHSVHRLLKLSCILLDRHFY